MIKINFIEILIFSLLILFKFAHCNNNIGAAENDFVGQIDGSSGEEYGNKRGGVWFGPRLGKRNAKDVDEVALLPLNELSFDSIPNSPYVMYLVTERLQTKNKNRYLTPRLGRDIIETLAIQRVDPVFSPRLGKKAIPFSPRLGRQLFER